MPGQSSAGLVMCKPLFTQEKCKTRKFISLPRGPWNPFFQNSKYKFILHKIERGLLLHPVQRFQINVQPSIFLSRDSPESEIMAHIWNSRTWEVTTGGSGVQGRSQLYRNFKATLSYIRLFFKKTQTTATDAYPVFEQLTWWNNMKNDFVLPFSVVPHISNNLFNSSNDIMVLCDFSWADRHEKKSICPR